MKPWMNDAARDQDGQDFSNVIARYEAERRKILPYAIGGGVFSVVAGVVAGFLSAPHVSEADDAYLIAFFVIFAGCLFAYSFLYQVGTRLKREIVPEIVGKHGLIYLEDASGMDVRRFEPVLPSYTSKRKEDQVMGDFDGINMRMCDLRLTRKSGKNSRTVFRGLIAEFEMPKRFTASIHVLSDKGSIGRAINGVFSSRERVRLEDPTFEEQFDVYSDDQIKARYILTPKMMERLAGFRRRHPGVQFLFVENRVLMTIPGHPNLFEFGSMLSPIDPRLADMFATDMEIIDAFIKQLALDSQSRL